MLARLIFSVNIILLCGYNSFGVTTTADSIFTYRAKINDSLSPVLHTKYLLHQYNPITLLGQYYAHRGNYGLPMQLLTYVAPASVLTTFAPPSMNAYLYTTDAANYYDTKRPYTDIQWINGLKKEQYVRVIHTQNLSPRWNVSIDFTRYRNKGYFLRSLANNAHFAATTKYTNKRNNYIVNAAYALNRISLQDNGGVDSASFVNIGFIDKNSIAPLLTNAARVSRSNSFMLNQQYYLVFKKDTLLKQKIIQTPYGVYINMQNNYNVLRNQYTDSKADSNFYKAFNYTSYYTADSNSVREHKHMFNIGYTSKTSTDSIPHWKHDVSFGVGLQQGKVNYYNKKLFTNNYLVLQRNTFSNTYAQWQATASNNNFNIHYNGQYVIAGYNANNVLNTLSVNYALTSTHLLHLSASNSVRTTNYLNTNYYSNNFKWDTTFNAVNCTQLKLGYANAQYRFGINAFVNTLQNNIYFNANANVAQSAATIVNNGIELMWQARYKKLNWQGNVVLQTNNNVNEFIAPQLLTRQLLYLQGSLFKNALPLQIGFDGSYTSTYKGYAYMPATMNYYIGNTTISGYPMVDFFMNAHIGQARVFVKAEHFLSGILGNNYFVVKNSPAHDRAIKIGIYWYMYN
jgi:hypothetical protein